MTRLSPIFFVIFWLWWVLMGLDGFWWGLMGLDEFWWVLMGLDGFGWVWMSFDGSWWVLMDFGRFRWVLMGFDGSWWVLMGFDGSWFFLAAISAWFLLAAGAARLVPLSESQSQRDAEQGFLIWYEEYQTQAKQVLYDEVTATWNYQTNITQANEDLMVCTSQFFFHSLLMIRLYFRYSVSIDSKEEFTSSFENSIWPEFLQFWFFLSMSGCVGIGFCSFNL